jgi:succinate dehydrogenase hydrophobic anchor subunit
MIMRALAFFLAIFILVLIFLYLFTKDKKYYEMLIKTTKNIFVVASIIIVLYILLRIVHI